MKWIEYKILQSVIGEQTILALKKVGYNDANLIIAQNEAYDGYTIVEDGQSYDKEPLAIEFGGTGAKDKDAVIESFGLVKKSGDDMTGALSVPYLLVKDNDYVEPVKITNASGQVRGMLRMTDKNGFSVQVRETGASFMESYDLPVPDTGLTAHKYYSILTGKTPVTIAQGGTGATTAAAALTNLGAAAASHNHAAGNITSGTLSSDRLPTVPLTKGGTGATTAAGALTNLGLTATAAELNYMDGVTSNVQTQLNAKQAKLTGGATTIVSSNLTASRALISNADGKVAVSAVTSTELGYLDGVTSKVQTQLNAKMPKTLTSNEYGTSLPTAGTKGRIFFKKV